MGAGVLPALVRQSERFPVDCRRRDGGYFRFASTSIRISIFGPKRNWIALLS
jgi:hypothetical protein